ncbi:MAG: YlxR family protein [Chloroflexi bacterium]|nr:YlxR family protein [Chloroflexota bacterium]MBA3739533.1 YlxR family protein [Chloroflexota bacterium]
MPKRRPDHIPTRTCAVCRTSRPKREMVRMVRTTDGSIHRDESGRQPGRGTYVCHEPACRDPQRAAAAVKRALGAEPAPGALEAEVNDAPT